MKNNIEKVRDYLDAGERRSGDWSIVEQSRCNCETCAQLNHFLSDTAKIIRLPLSKDKRQHLHQQISEMGIEVSHQTERKGRPFSLVLSKLPEIFKEDKKRFQTYQKLIEEYQQMADLLP